MTEAQGRILEALRELTSNGWPASVRDVCRRAGTSVGPTHSHLRALIEQGLVERHPTNPKMGFRPVVADDLSVR